MPRRTRIERRHRKVPLGDLRDRVKLVSRGIAPPKANAPTGAGATFARRRDVWASIMSVVGAQFFDGHNVDREVTHVLLIRYDATVTAETWVELSDGTHLDIVEVQDLERRREYLRLTCVERGLKSKAANLG